ncbi:MAG: ABC transporter ATP-binding protein [Firmicutes bacterium]|nr:ABC transporter ATP-binding protein [Bacillota bacterium]
MTVLLESKGICKYFGGLKAVEKVDMQIKQGEIFGIIGPNGAGKTTFFNVCSGIYAPTAGEIWFNEENVTGMRPEEVAIRGMARTFQNIQLFKYMSVLENIKIGFHLHTKTNIFDAIMRNKRYKHDESLAKNVGLEILDQVGLTEYKDVQAENLSYGMQRKVEIARAMALAPKILLLDEPAAGMNPQETISLLKFMQNLNKQGYTIVVIEHDMKFMMNLCHRILVLNFGTVICQGSCDDVKNDPAVIEAYIGKGFTL